MLIALNISEAVKTSVIKDYLDSNSGFYGYTNEMSKEKSS